MTFLSSLADTTCLCNARIFQWKESASGWGHSRGLDGDAALLLILPRVGDPRLAGFGRGDDAGLGDERVGQGGLSVINVSNHGHVADVVLLVHDRPDLVDREVHLRQVQSRVSHEEASILEIQILSGPLQTKPLPSHIKIKAFPLGNFNDWQYSKDIFPINWNH